jgi:hypothetical protein
MLKGFGSHLKSWKNSVVLLKCSSYVERKNSIVKSPDDIA